MSRLLVARFLTGVSLAALAGCSLFDPLETDPNIARISAVSVVSVPAAVREEPVFVRLATRFDTTDTEASAGPFPLTLATAREVGVESTDGRFWDGEALSVEVRRCVDECATSEVVGSATVPPEAWDGTEKPLVAGEAQVVLVYRKTTS